MKDVFEGRFATVMRRLLFSVAVVATFLLPGTVWTQDKGAVPPTGEVSGSRDARLEERYRAMLDSNPAEGMVLDRLWKTHEGAGTTAALIDSYRARAEAADAPANAMLVYGHLLKRTGKLDEAAAWYARAAERSPTDALPVLAQADLLSQRGLGERAAETYGNALDKLPASDRRRTDVLLKQGAAWLAAGEPGEAAASWEKIVANHPNDLGVRKQLAEACEKNGLRDRAASHYEFIAAHAGPAERAGAWRELGRLREAQGDFDGARAALEKGLELTARDNWLHGDLQERLIRLYERAGRADELAARWRAAVAAAPRDVGGYLRLEALAEARGDAAGQREWLEKIVALVPRDRENVLKLAARDANAGEFQKAAALYDGLLKSQPGNVDLIMARADLDVQMGQIAAATKRLEERVAQSADDEGTRTAALNFFLAHHLSEGAERLLRGEVTRQPSAPEPSLALAKFLFAERRGSEAAAVLAALVDRPGDAAEQVNRLSLAAEAYKAGNLPDEALRCWRRVADLHPTDPAPLLAEAELQHTAGEYADAADLLERAARLAPTEEARWTTEKKLFDLLRSEEGGGMPVTVMTPGETGRRTALRPGKGSKLDRYLHDLATRAKAEKTVPGYLRLARWESWAHENEAALAACREAIAIDPGNLPARELSADIAEDSHRNELAEQMLNERLALDPANENTILRQLAKLKLQSGDNEGALNLFAHLQTLAPGSRTALTDLALAQQRLDRWFDAKVTWEQAYALPGGTPTERAEVRRALLGACEHLGQFERAVELLSEAVDDQPDEAAKEDVFRQMAEMASKHGLDGRVRDEFEARRQRRPDDYFTLVALAQLHRDEGDPDGAYRLLQQARYSSPDPVRSERMLVEEAENLGKIVEAENHQARLTAMPKQFTAENLEKLAALQEAGFDLDEAKTTWNQAVARFSREPQLLEKAADFFDRVGQPTHARDLQKQAVTLEPTNFARVLRLAALDLRVGDLSAALASYDDVLAHTQAEAPGQPLSPPEELVLRRDPIPGVFTGTVRVIGSKVVAEAEAAASGSPSKSPDPDRSLRWQVITEASQTLFDARWDSEAGVTAARERWLARWQSAADAGQRSEPLMALYFTGRKDVTMALLARWLDASQKPEPAVRDAFLCAGIQWRDYSALSQWTWSKPQSPERPALLISALLQYLGTGGKPGPALVSTLFPPESDAQQELLWDAAKSLASLHWYGLAGDLGAHALAHAPGRRAALALQVSEWQLTGGNPDAARQALKTALHERGGWSFDPGDSPIFSVLREYYLLLPEAERPAFVTDYLGSTNGAGEKLHALLSALLLHGLAGDDAAAHHDLDELLRRRTLANDEDDPSPDDRRWSFLLTNGVQLQAWNLDHLAAYLWEHALEEATVLDTQSRAEGGSISEIRRRLLGIMVARAEDPEQAREIVASYLETKPPSGTALSVAGELTNDSRYASALQICEYLCRIEPGNPEHWRRLLSIYEATGDSDRLEEALEKLLADGQSLPEGLSRSDFVCRWAAARERNGDAEGARRILETEHGNSPADLPVLVLLAQMCERSGRYDQAADLWRETIPLVPTDLPVLNLANLAEKRGQTAQAITLLEGALMTGKEGGSSEAAARLARLYVASGKTDNAVTLARNLLRSGKVEALVPIASALSSSGQTEEATGLLDAGIARAHDPATRFRLQQEIVALSPPFVENPKLFLRALARLESFAREVPNLRNGWETTKYKLARQAGADAWLEADLRRRWDGGKGDYIAGDRLCALYLDTHREGELARTVDEFNHRPKLPDQLLYGIEKALLAGEKASLALPLSERLYQRFPQNLDYANARAITLWKTGQRDEADRIFDALDSRTVLQDDLTEQLALTFLGIGEKTRARAMFGRVVRSDPRAIRSPGSFLQLARLNLEAGKVDDAKPLLVTAYRQEACDDFSPLVNWLVRDHQLDGEQASSMPAEDFLLSYRRRATLLAAVHDYLNQNNRNAEARRLLRAHAAFLAETPRMATALVEESPPEEQPLVKRCLQRAVEAIKPPAPRLTRLLTGVPPVPQGTFPPAKDSAALSPGF